MRRTWLATWILIAACDGQRPSAVDEVHDLAEALRLAETDPEAAAALCRAMDMPGPRRSCAWGVAEAIGGAAPKVGASLCQELSDFRKDECYFVLARAAGDVSLCARAGDFAIDCERHVFVPDLPNWLDGPMEPGQLEPEVLAALPRFAVEPHFEPLWTELYRRVFLDRHPIDSRDCEAVEDEILRGYCRDVAQDLVRYALDFAVEQGKLFCEGEPPRSLARHDDPFVQELIDSYRAAGRCRAGVGQARAPKNPSRRSGLGVEATPEQAEGDAASADEQE